MLWESICFEGKGPGRSAPLLVPISTRADRQAAEMEEPGNTEVYVQDTESSTGSEQARLPAGWNKDAAKKCTLF